ncbi:transglutaminase-like domain-containing protein [Verrucomicrobiota bacterium sgz303538]
MKHCSALAICHFAFLAGIALYLAAFYPACRILAILLVLAGAMVESWPRIYQKPLVPELLLGTAVAGTWWHWLPSATTGDAYRAVGAIAAYLLLIPSRMDFEGTVYPVGIAGSKPAPGRLKWLLALVIVEVVFGTRLPGSELAATIAIAIGLAALAVDSWLAGAIPARVSNPAAPSVGASVLRWAILPVLLVLAGTGLIGTRVMDVTASYHAAHQFVRTSQAEEGPELLNWQEDMSLGDHRSMERDPRIVARLSWESGSAPTGMVYLRALALPDLVLTGPVVAWGAQSHGERRTLPAISEPKRWAQVHRVASGSEIVLRPDGNNTVELPEISSDNAGNIYSAGLRNREYTYRVRFDDDQPLKADPALIQRCLEVDPRLNALPWEKFEDPRWRPMSPERAAALVCSRLQTGCSYDLQNLPPPMDGPGGVLRGFLFGSTPEARRGHCQYFATAAVLLLRRAGHPARCVNGFASDEIDSRGVTFRELHLHAWIEVINSQGEWQRFDPSPDSRMARILAGGTLPPVKAHPPEPPLKEKPAASSPQVHRWPRQATPTFLSMLLGALAILGAFRCRKWFSGASRPRDPRLIELQRRNDDLIKVAAALGIMVTPATTLSDLVAALERRTHISLDEHRRAHLAARFGQGPIPPPWPIEMLVNAARGNAEV